MHFTAFLVFFALFLASLPVLFAIDLVRRPVAVEPLWWVSLVLAAGMGAIVGDSRGPYELTLNLCISLHITSAFAWTDMALALSLSRALRPDEENPPYATRAGVTGLVLALVVVAIGSLLAVSNIPKAGILFLQVPISWVLLWSLFSGRGVGARARNARETGAAWILSALVSAWTTWLHLLPRLWTRLDGEDAAWLTCFATLTVVLLLFVRWNSPIRWRSALPALLGLGTLGLPALAWTVPLMPTDRVVPELVDFSGHRVPNDDPNTYVECVQYVDSPPPSPRCQGHEQWAFPPSTPLTEVRTPADQTVLIDAGMGDLEGSRLNSFLETPLVVFEQAGRAAILGKGVSFPLDATLDAYLQGQADGPLHVVRTPDWTFQDFVSMCASLNREHPCALVDTPSERWPGNTIDTGLPAPSLHPF